MLNNVFLSFPSLLILSSTTLLILFGTNNEIASTPNGSNTLLTEKSTKSKNVFPNIFTSLIIPNDNADGIPTAKIRIPINNDADGRFFSLPSQQMLLQFQALKLLMLKSQRRIKLKHNKEKLTKWYFCKYCWKDDKQ